MLSNKLSRFPPLPETNLLPMLDRYARRDLLIIRVPDDPVLELCYPRVDAGPVAVAATDAPTDDPGQLVPEDQMFNRLFD